MTIGQRLSLLWRRFTPLEKRLLGAVRGAMPAQVQPAFDAQVAAITHVQRLPGWTEIAFYRRRRWRTDWDGVPLFPRTAEFPLAEVRFSVARRRYKATLTSLGGHIFDFGITPSPQGVAFTDWDGPPTVRLLGDPLATEELRPLEPIPGAWLDFLARHQVQAAGGWTFHDARTVYRVTLDDGEFLVLAERAGNEFVLHRIEPPGSTLFHLASHDGSPEPIRGTIADVLQ
jgi:hypothetical protein